MDGFIQLTHRELEVLALVAEGKPNREIAQELWIEESTVETHLCRIFRKLNVPNRTAAAIRYTQHNNGEIPAKNQGNP